MMKTRTLIVVLAAAAVFVGRSAAQHENHQAAPSSPQTGATDTGKTGMMSGGMMSQMPMMMQDQKDLATLVDRLQQSFAAIEAEKDPAALRTKLAEHGAMLKELQTKVEAESHRMEMMHQMMSGPMMGKPTPGNAPDK
jgi:hypothetical protein